MDQFITTDYFSTPFGELILGEFEDQLCLCDWRYRKNREGIDQRVQKGLNADYLHQSSSFLDRVKTELNEYFEGHRTTFNIPLLPVGSEFQQMVWKELIQIPFGETKSYLDLSKKLGKVKAIRAVASANGANAISIFIPCHRIIGSDGSLTGYAGGIDAKRKLLQLENANIDNQLSLF